MDWITTTARTVEEAQARALDLLGVDISDAQIEVLEEGKTGLFGRTKSEARVRARIRPKAPVAKEERRPVRDGDGDRGRSRRGRENGKGSDGPSRERSNRRPEGRDGARNGGRDAGRDGGRNGGRATSDGGRHERSAPRQDPAPVDAVAASASVRAESGRSGGRDSGGRDSGGRDSGRNRNRNDRPRGGGADRDAVRGEDRVEMPVDEQRENLELFMAGVARAFDPNAKVALIEDGTTLQAQVTGQDLGRLVGAKATTLHALEELARTAMHRAAAGRRYHRIQVDVDDYRLRRREALVRFATGLADEVARTGQSKALEPMGAADRKLIHDAVAEVGGATTISEGRDPRRYIVITPIGQRDEEE